MYWVLFQVLGTQESLGMLLSLPSGLQSSSSVRKRACVGIYWVIDGCIYTFSFKALTLQIHCIVLSVPTLAAGKLWDHTFEVINTEAEGKRNGSKYYCWVLLRPLQLTIKIMVLQEKDFRSARGQVLGFLNNRYMGFMA